MKRLSAAWPVAITGRAPINMMEGGVGVAGGSRALGDPLAALRACRWVTAAALAATGIVGAPIPARGQGSDFVLVAAHTRGIDCANLGSSKEQQFGVQGVEETHITAGGSARATSEIRGNWCKFAGGGENRERAEATMDAEHVRLRLFAEVVSGHLDDEFAPRAEATVDAAYAFSAKVPFDRKSKSVHLLLDLGGFIGPNTICGLVGDFPPPPPGSSCAEATIQSQEAMYDWTERRWVAKGRPLSLNSLNMSAGGPPRRFSLESPRISCDGFESEPGFEKCYYQGPTVALRAVVQGRGLVSLADTATLYLELPEGATFLGSLGGHLGIARSDFVSQAGQAIPAPEGSLTISPGSGVLVAGQAFDLVLTIQTAGQGVAGAAATLDGNDISALLVGCVGAHVGALRFGTPGFVARCPGLNGSLFAPGTHTLAVTLTLSGGGTLTDTVVWEVPGAGPPAGAPRLEVSPPAGPLAQNQAFDLVLFADPAGRAVVGRQVTFDDRDVTALVAGCPQTTLPSGQIAVRCPGLTGGFLGLGTHTLQVTFSLSDGSTLDGGAVWQVLAAPGS